MLTVCYYGEFDPFSGSVDRRYECIDDVVGVLAMLCLLHDVVIVPPGALLDHPLGLPAFERLAPLARAGVLGTTASPSEPGPRTYMKERVRRRVDGRLDRRGGSLKSSDVVELQSRLSDILPAQWTITRDVARQVSGSAEHVRRFCETTAATMTAARTLLALMDATNQRRGTPLERNELLGHLAALRGDVSPHELSVLAMAVQAAYFTFGARGHLPEGAEIQERSCTLFPGAFARLLHRRAANLRALGSPPYDRSAAPVLVRARMRRLGLDLDTITRLPPQALLEIARSPEWAPIRTVLRAQALPEDLVTAVRDTFERSRDFRDKLCRASDLLTAAGYRPVPTVLPGPWQLAAQAVLGWSPDVRQSAHRQQAILDLRTLTIRGGQEGTEVQLSRTIAHLLAILAIAGDDGLALGDVKQLLLELDLLRGATATSPCVAWRPVGHAGTRRRESLENRVHVEKNRANRALAHAGLVIAVSDSGKWRLLDARGEGVLLRIHGTPLRGAGEEPLTKACGPDRWPCCASRRATLRPGDQARGAESRARIHRSTRSRALRDA
ncbi:hypothetical protein BE21_06080 [Sorangium cellulosum]|uniref:Uncharacterized protein n=1 Tax=Sorangium cellulosum TaxID=56 RepID=A0A150TAH3_SORCE|nr:hypothetical protein BE21_06080 [Sorangium cellulosum]